jgi:hypothetical protein
MAFQILGPLSKRMAVAAALLLDGLLRIRASTP